MTNLVQKEQISVCWTKLWKTYVVTKFFSDDIICLWTGYGWEEYLSANDRCINLNIYEEIFCISTSRTFIFSHHMRMRKKANHHSGNVTHSFLKYMTYLKMNNIHAGKMLTIPLMKTTMYFSFWEDTSDQNEIKINILTVGKSYVFSFLTWNWFQVWLSRFYVCRGLLCFLIH